MMNSSQSILERLKALQSSEFVIHQPTSQQNLEEIERQYHLNFPDDYKQLMLYSNGFALYNESQLLLHSIMELNAFADEDIMNYMPGIFVIGSDAGGNLYYFDLNNRLGYGNYAIFLVPPSELSFDDSIFVGHAITEVITNILNGERFFYRPRYGELRDHGSSS